MQPLGAGGAPPPYSVTPGHPAGVGVVSGKEHKVKSLSGVRAFAGVWALAQHA